MSILFVCVIHSKYSPDLLYFRGRAASIAIIVLGSIHYTWVKHVESQDSAGVPEKRENGGGEYERVPLEDIEANRRGSNDLHEKPE